MVWKLQMRKKIRGRCSSPKFQKSNQSTQQDALPSTKQYSRAERGLTVQDHTQHPHISQILIYPPQCGAARGALSRCDASLYRPVYSYVVARVLAPVAHLWHAAWCVPPALLQNPWYDCI